jgi:hypothetical protein
MEHKFGRMARLLLMQLEERSQSGSLLINGIELGGLADVFARPPQQESAPVFKRIRAPKDTEIVKPSAIEGAVAAPAAKEVHATDTAVQPHQRQVLRLATHHPGLGVAVRGTGGHMVLQNGADRIHPASAGAVDTAEMQFTSADEFMAR